jgi:hypothetical protein
LSFYGWGLGRQNPAEEMGTRIMVCNSLHPGMNPSFTLFKHIGTKHLSSAGLALSTGKDDFSS